MTILCKDCRWFEVGGGCNAPQNRIKIKTTDLVYGKPSITSYGHRWLTNERLRTYTWPWDILFQACGRRARWFEALKS